MMIGELARATTIKVTTIRFYEGIGLIENPDRTASGRRIYRPADVERLHFIRNGRRLGFSIDEIRSLIALANEPERDCAEAARIAAGHLVEVEKRLGQLTALRDELATMSESGCTAKRMSDCKVIEAIGRGVA
jgi:DNA-binding transcriptional MerR regulator